MEQSRYLVVVSVYLAAIALPLVPISIEKRVAATPLPDPEIIRLTETKQADSGGAASPETQAEPEPRTVPEDPVLDMPGYASAHFHLHSDLHPEFCAQVLEHMERVLNVYRDLLPDCEAAIAAHPLRMRLFAEMDAFQAYHRSNWREDGTRTNFVYHHTVDRERRELCGFWKPIEPFWASLHHEMFHAYFRATIGYPPQWINEGLAEYLEATVFPPDGEPQHELHLAWIKQLREQVVPDRGRYRLVPTRELIRMTKTDWLRESGATYGLSWALVYWLRHVREGGEALLRRYLDALRGGATRPENNDAGWQAAFTPAGNPDGPGIAEIEDEFTAWVRTLDFGEGWEHYQDGRQADDDEERLRHFQLAVATEPRFPSSLYFLAAVELRLGKPAEALQHAEQAMMVFPEYSSGMQVAIRAAAALERWDVVEYWSAWMRRFAPQYLQRVTDEVAAVEAWRTEHPEAPSYNPNPLPSGRVPE